mmetsp:Transcript_59536/g.154647  ORF Transcript_59536/g.154647 Transcript_59536/m.154647 type:complete len:228 (-) Transcript_59536:422-1105(-)
MFLQHQSLFFCGHGPVSHSYSPQLICSFSQHQLLFEAGHGPTLQSYHIVDVVVDVHVYCTVVRCSAPSGYWHPQIMLASEPPWRSAMFSLQATSSIALHPGSPSITGVLSLTAPYQHSCPKLAQYASQVRNAPTRTRCLHSPQSAAPSLFGHAKKLLHSSDDGVGAGVRGGPGSSQPQTSSRDELSDASSSRSRVSPQSTCFCTSHGPCPTFALLSCAARKHNCPKL